MPVCKLGGVSDHNSEYQRAGARRPLLTGRCETYYSRDRRRSSKPRRAARIRRTAPPASSPTRSPTRSRSSSRTTAPARSTTTVSPSTTRTTARSRRPARSRAPCTRGSTATAPRCASPKPLARPHPLTRVCGRAVRALDGGAHPNRDDDGDVLVRGRAREHVLRGRRRADAPEHDGKRDDG